jgi:hypothetical protein
MMAEYGVLISSTLGAFSDYISRTYHSLEALHLFAVVVVALLALVIFKR